MNTNRLATATTTTCPCGRDFTTAQTLEVHVFTEHVN